MRRITLYEEIGGAAVVGAVVDHFYDALAADPLVQHLFDDASRQGRLRSSLRSYLGQLLGGPERYEGPDLATAHAGVAITDEQVDAVLAHLAGALASAEVDADPARQVVALASRLWMARRW